MSLGEQIRSGVKWLAFGKVGGRFMEFGFGVILARLLVPADFGMMATIAVFTGFVGMFASGGMGQSIIRAKTADQDDFTAVFTLQLGFGIVAYTAFFIAAPWIADAFDNPIYTDLTRVSALSFLIRPFAAMRNAWLNREMSFKSRSLVDVSNGFIVGVASSLMAWLGMGVWSLALSGLLAALLKNIWLAYLTPLELRLNFDLATMRKHSSYGSMIVANDFITYLRSESKKLILSKMAGPAFLGLYNKGESLSRLPNQMLMSPTVEPLFRAMGKVQDNLDTTKYLFYRAIALLTAYTVPAYVLIWWIAEPFIGIVYGEKWLAAAGPMGILAAAGVFLNVIYPCGVVLAAQNRLKQELAAQSINLVIVVAASLIGLEWGLEGVAWGIVLSHGLLATHFYALVCRVLPTRFSDLLRSVAPGLSLGAIMIAALWSTDLLLADLELTHPFSYLLVVSVIGGLSYITAFFLIPFQGLKSEGDRWRRQLAGGAEQIRGFFSRERR